jgi:undecaprenyl pyrophosphate phosphatase UppP
MAVEDNTLGYQRYESTKSKPLLGRIAAVCNALGVSSFVMLYLFADRWGAVNWPQDFIGFFFATVFGVALITSVLALMRRESRTVLAIISLVIAVQIYLFFIPGFFSDK